jgi:hypothetical protein
VEVWKRVVAYFTRPPLARRSPPGGQVFTVDLFTGHRALGSVGKIKSKDLTPGFVLTFCDQKVNSTDLTPSFGLLEGRRATTHWQSAERLRSLYPQIDVHEDAIFIKDGSLYTSAGVTAGIDLALALLEEDHGPLLALNVARLMVLHLKRPGGQSQFSTGITRCGSTRKEGSVSSYSPGALRHTIRSIVVPNLRTIV